MKLKNGAGKPLVFYGLHMVEGVAEYQEPEKEPYRILVGESAIKNMNPSFQGCPVYVDHVDEVDLDNIREEADGYVMESFFNKADGKNWVKFIVVSDRAKEAIKMGWKLSNAYVPTSFAGGGLWHGVEYAKEVMGGEYEHLAIVSNPRYEESVILTPEQFKEHNGEKESELLRLANSKDQKKEKVKMKFNLFKRTKVENSTDIEGMLVSLPKCKKDVLLTEVIEGYDTVLNMHGYANGDHLVKVGDKDEMSVNDLVKKHMEMCNKMSEMESAKNDGEGEPGVDVEDEGMENDDDEAGTVDEGTKDVGDRGGDDSLDNADGDDEAPKDKKKNAAEKAKADKAAAIKAKNERLKNAQNRERDQDSAPRIFLASDQVARGKTRYGS